MMQSDATEVNGYLATAPSGRRAALDALRVACRELLVGFEESMAHGMPSYSRDDVVEVAFASQKDYLAIYILRTDVLNRHRDHLDGAHLGKGTIRYRNVDDIDLAIIKTMLRETVESSGPVC